MGPEWIMTPENEFVRVSSIVSAFIGKVYHRNGEDDTTLVIVDVNNNQHIVKRYSGCVNEETAAKELKAFINKISGYDMIDLFGKKGE